MGTVVALATGNWNDGTKWNGGSPPGNNDTGSIPTGVTITITAAAQALGIEIAGGSLIINADFTFTDGVGAGFSIQSDQTGSVTTNGTASSPRILKSASTTPTYPWQMSAEDYAGLDARVMNFDYVEMRGSKFFLGNDTYNITFNGGAVDDPICLPLAPITRDVILEEHKIRGRPYGRVYPGYHGAGAVTITGCCTLASQMWQMLLNMDASDQRLAFFSHWVHMPKCRIETYRFRPRGGQYIDFSITLREDI